MKKLLIHSLLICLALPFVTKTAIVFNYLAKLNYYAQVLCENKNKPELNCNGKCALMKELANESPSTDAPVAPLNVLQYELNPFVLQGAETTFFKTVEKNKPTTKLILSYQFDFLTTIFCPPETI